jgi:hypothetical protein
MIHKLTAFLLFGVLLIAYSIGLDIYIKLSWILCCIVVFSTELSTLIAKLLQKPLNGMSQLINFVSLFIFYFFLLTPFALIFNLFSYFNVQSKITNSNFTVRNHEYNKKDLIRTF